MKVLVLGGSGMAGHMIVQYFKRKTDFEVLYTTRDSRFKGSISLDVRNFNDVEEVIKKHRPDIVINAVGLLNEHAESQVEDALLVNSLLPYHLANLLDSIDSKLIHISTDCVFSGKKGDYIETDEKDGTNVYAKTKALGEIERDPHLTIRTSIIGPELKEDGIGLFLWFMKQKGTIHGYENVYWNGVTTLQLSKTIKQCISNNVSGLHHLCNDTKISKYELLQQFKSVFEKDDVIILPYKHLKVDKSLKNTRDDIQSTVPGYKEMLYELKAWMRDEVQ
jgi:dTDP-4-dehydrorhamnose reductase